VCMPRATRATQSPDVATILLHEAAARDHLRARENDFSRTRTQERKGDKKKKKRERIKGEREREKKLQKQSVEKARVTAAPNYSCISDSFIFFLHCRANLRGWPVSKSGAVRARSDEHLPEKCSVRARVRAAVQLREERSSRARYI